MFVKAYKISGRRLVAVGVMCLAVIGLVVYGVGNRISAAGSEARAEAGVRAQSGRAAKGHAKTAEERTAFITQFGWDVQAEPVEVTEVIIPEEFDDVYARYNELQKQQGYDLEKYKGKRCKRYTYEVLNYPDTKQEVHISLMVLGDRVVGGDVSSTALDGFMQGFAQDSTAMSTAELETSVQEHSTQTDEAPIEETMAAELEAMEEALRDGVVENLLTEEQMPTD